MSGLFNRFLKRNMNKKITKAVQESTKLDKATSPRPKGDGGVQKTLRQVRNKAAQIFVIGMSGAGYLLLLTGSINEADFVNLVIGAAFFISTTVILLVIRRERKRSKRENEKLNDKIDLMQSDVITMNTNYKNRMDELVEENVRQSNHFNAMMETVDEFGIYCSMIYSYTQEKVLKVNKSFIKTFGLNADQINNDLYKVTEKKCLSCKVTYCEHKIDEDIKSQALFRLIIVLANPENHIKLKNHIRERLNGYEGEREMTLVLKRKIPNRKDKLVPFNIKVSYLAYHEDNAIQIIFVDTLTETTVDEILRMHYGTIIEYTKDILKRNLDEELAQKLIIGMHNYQKVNKRIKIDQTIEV